MQAQNEWHDSISIEQCAAVIREISSMTTEKGSKINYIEASK